MTRYCGLIGYCDTVEDPEGSGIWVEKVVEKRKYFGDVLEARRRYITGTGINDDIQVTNRISIVADMYATQNINKMRWAEWNGVKWIVTEVEIQRPRLILTLGGEWRDGSETDETQGATGGASGN